MVWQAQFDNQYHDDVEIIVKPGPKVNTTTAVASGQVEFGLQASDSVMLANSKGACIKGNFCKFESCTIHISFSSKYWCQIC